MGCENAKLFLSEPLGKRKYQITASWEGNMKKRIHLKGGRVFLSERETIENKDIVVSDGKILKIGDDVASEEQMEVIHAEGKLITPGLIDFHMHAFRYGHFLSIDTEELSPRSGTTTFVDGGSAGSLGFMAFREYVIKPAKSNILAWLNISAIGQTTDGVKGLTFHDCDVDELLHIPSALEVIEKNRDLIVGIKARAYTGLKNMLPMEKARELADLVNLPIMVHLAPPPPEFEDILSHLKEGDIITHPYHGGAKTILDEKGRVRPEYWEAKKRGIEVDLGLDRFHCDLTIMQQAVELGFHPDYISTDLAMTNLRSIVYDLPTTVSKVIASGISMTEALTKCTYAPALKMGKEQEIGLIREGAPADIAIFDIKTDDHAFEDYFGHVIRGRERLVPFMTMRKGEILQKNDRTTEVLDVFNRGNPWKDYDLD
jgi:dihydroorotase